MDDPTVKNPLERALSSLRGEGAPVAPPVSADPTPPDLPLEALLTGWVTAASRGAFGGRALDPEAPLFGSGYLDSLSVVAFLARVEDHFGVRVPERLVAGPRGTLRGVAAYIAERQDQARKAADV